MSIWQKIKNWWKFHVQRHWMIRDRRTGELVNAADIKWELHGIFAGDPTDWTNYVLLDSGTNLDDLIKDHAEET